VNRKTKYVYKTLLLNSKGVQENCKKKIFVYKDNLTGTTNRSYYTGIQELRYS